MSYKMFVFEGPECVGKSTIVRRLADAYGGELGKRVATRDSFHRLYTVTNDIATQLLRTSNDLDDASARAWEAPRFFDRWQLVSDMIYSPIYGAPSIFAERYPWWLTTCQRAGIRIYILMTTKKTMLERFEVRGDLFIGAEGAAQAYEAYVDYVQYWEKFPCIKVIDVEGLNQEEAYEKVKKIVSEDLGGRNE